MEQKIDCYSMEDARNQAVAKLSELMGGGLGPYVKIVVAKNMGGSNPLAGAEVGVEWGKKGRIRLDFDPSKGPHYNVESRTENWAFCFPYNGHNGLGGNWATISDEEKEAVKEWMAKIGSRRGPR